MERWRGWWRIVRMDQWVIYFVGALLGMMLPAVLYVTFLEPGTDIRGYGIAATLASAMEARLPLMGGVVAFLGAWILFKTQLDVIEGMVRAVTDILWTGSKRVREWRGGDVRAVYYGIMALMVLWGVIALRLTQPIILLQMAANIAGLVMVAGIVLMLRERHEHLHAHELLEHEHAHVHDEHHQHRHADGPPESEPHSHQHRHDPLVHTHAHVSDVHHRHRH